MNYYVPAWMDESIGMNRPIEKYEYGLFISPEEAWMFCLKDANAGETERTINVSETDDIMDSMIFVTYNDGTVGVHFVKKATLRNYFRDQTFVCEYIDSLYREINETYKGACYGVLFNDTLDVWLSDVNEVAPGAFKLKFKASWRCHLIERELIYSYVEDEYYERGENKDIDKYFEEEAV